MTLRSMVMQTREVRQAEPADLQQMWGLFNEIIEIGGTTAFLQALPSQAFAEKFYSSPACQSSLVALDNHGDVAGFQVLLQHDLLPAGWLDIATFARQKNKRPGVGTALFAQTVRVARQLGCQVIGAYIRADNSSGLAYYEKMGFVPHSVDHAVPLSDGTPVDRVLKKFPLTATAAGL